MEDEGYSWVRRTKFSHTIYHRWDSIPSHRFASHPVLAPSKVPWSAEFEPAMSQWPRRGSVDSSKNSRHSPNGVAHRNHLAYNHRSVSPTPELVVSDAFKEARLDLKRFSTPRPQRNESDRGIAGKLFRKDAKGPYSKYSPGAVPHGPLSTMRGHNKKHRKDLPWSKIFDQSGGRVTAVEEVHEHRADISQLLLGQRFAYGAHSRIHRGIYKDEAVAVKIITVPDDDENGCLSTLMQKHFSREVNFLSRLQHPNIIKLVGAWKEPPVYFIIAEYLSEGSLRAYLHKHQVLPLQKTVELCLQIARGMEFVHSQGIIHRDLKPENILISEDIRIKIADFGTACEEVRVDHFSDDPGTYRWMAPEMIKHKPYGRKVDVYSFGLILWEMVAGKIPYGDMNPVQAAFAVVSKDLRPEFSKDFPPAIRELIEHCWVSNSEKRPEFSKIVKVLEHFESALAHECTLPLALDSSWLNNTRKNSVKRVQNNQLVVSPLKPKFS